MGLAEVVAAVKLDPGWSVTLEPTDRRGGTRRPTVVIRALVFDTYHPDLGRTYTATHFFPAPPVCDDWSRWLFARYLDVLHHEAGETFTVAGARPFAPGHGPGRDPYLLAGGLPDA